MLMLNNWQASRCVTVHFWRYIYSLEKLDVLERINIQSKFPLYSDMVPRIFISLQCVNTAMGLLGLNLHVHRVYILM